MNTLLIDIGNTRIKWRHVDAQGWRTKNLRGAVTHVEVEALRAQWKGLDSRLDRIAIANVAGAGMLARIEAMLPAGPATIEILAATPARCGVVNVYPEPQRLGADRWAALIAAHALHPHAACLIVSLGTATTIDLLEADGRFAGGVILPGIVTMRRSLAQNTAQLPEAVGRFTALADNTADAIESGILHAQLGAIERLRRHAQTMLGVAPVVLIGGGDAARVAPMLTFETRLEDQLVLRGLYEVARDGS